MISSCTSLWGNNDELSDISSGIYTPTPFLPVEDPTSTDISPQTTNENSLTYPTSGAISEELVWISQAVPQSLYPFINHKGIQLTSDKGKTNYRLSINPSGGFPKSSWIYVLVVPFPSVTDDVSWAELQATWKGESSSDKIKTPIRMDAHTYEAISSIIGPPVENIVQIDTSENLLEDTWGSKNSLAIIPFEDLQPRWKVIKIDSQSPISNKFTLESYPLKITFGFEEGLNPTGVVLPATNRDPDKLTVLAMTGVTALVRATAAKMERNGVLYPAKDIRDWLVEADLTHISNEIPFAKDCPYPDPNQVDLVFCSDPKYIGLLEDVGTDIVELTGNHFQDWGSEATLKTIEMYKQRNWLYYGGGIDRADAIGVKTVVHNGNKFAFIGCNPAGPQFAWATDDQPGAAPCNYAWMQGEIARFRADGYLPIVTFQYNESYSIEPLPDQVQVFQNMAEAGAVIVSGSQAHLPQTMEFVNNNFVHYGLGNLFFDQMDYPVVGTRREFIDRHIFYDGKYISTELLTATLEDYSRPRPMTKEERDLFLSEIFSASGW